MVDYNAPKSDDEPELDAVEKLDFARDLIAEAEEEIGAGLIVGQLSAARLIVSDVFDFLTDARGDDPDFDDDPPRCERCGEPLEQEDYDY